MKVIDSNTSIAELQHYLESKGWIENETIIRSEIPGDGNMNVVLAVVTDRRKVILKQSRPYVQKYPQIAAPTERIKTEYQFYQTILDSGIGQHFPKIIAFDETDNIMMMEYISDAVDMVALYREQVVSDNELDALVKIIKTIHHCRPKSTFPENMLLRELNHQHIFVLPFLENNGFQLDVIQDGLEGISLRYKKDKDLARVVKNIGRRYLSKGEFLLHGDYYPGSWMRAAKGLYVIDPEFSHLGFKEFDIGVMIAHLIMATGDEEMKSKILSIYSDDVDEKLIHQITGIEIMRRLIGLAQLPLTRTLAEKEYLLQLAYKMILS